MRWRNDPQNDLCGVDNVISKGAICNLINITHLNNLIKGLKLQNPLNGLRILIPLRGFILKNTILVKLPAYFFGLYNLKIFVAVHICHYRAVVVIPFFIESDFPAALDFIAADA